MSDPELLLASLDMAVPVRIAELRGLDVEARLRLGRQAAQVIAAHGDLVLYRSKRRGETAAAWAALVTALAVLAFAEGGVAFAGRRWAA